jgi:hypothetical protein
MTRDHPGKSGRWALFAPLVVVPVAFFASLPWLAEQRNEALTNGIAAACAVFVMGYSVFVARRVARRMDEVELAGDRFASAKGWQFGSLAAVLLMMFTPINEVLVDLAYGGAGPEDPEKTIRLGIWFGIIFAIALQGLATFAVSIWWRRRIVGPPA